MVTIGEEGWVPRSREVSGMVTRHLDKKARLCHSGRRRRGARGYPVGASKLKTTQN